MKFGSSCLILSIFISSILLGNISSIENKFIYSLLSSNQDTTFKDSITLVSGSNIPGEKFKSLGKTMLYSGILPGLGQVYLGKWERGLIYLVLDAVAAGVWYQNNIRAEARKKDYQSYAADHWDFALWVRDYYKWWPENNPGYDYDTSWVEIRDVFINKENDYYFDIWDHSHSIDFDWQGDKVSSSDYEEFKDIYTELCAISLSQFDPLANNYDPQCNIDDIEDIRRVAIENGFVLDNDFHFHEGIQKYPNYFAGWDDTDRLYLTNSGNNNTIIRSPNQTAFQNIRTDYNRIKILAGRGGNFMLINRFVSVIDALFLTKKWNSKHAVKLNLDIYPDLRNKSGIGGMKLIMGWG